MLYIVELKVTQILQRELKVTFSIVEVKVLQILQIARALKSDDIHSRSQSASNLTESTEK